MKYKLSLIEGVEVRLDQDQNGSLLDPSFGLDL